MITNGIGKSFIQVPNLIKNSDLVIKDEANRTPQRIPKPNKQ
jgi:hypothetical protein